MRIFDVERNTDERRWEIKHTDGAVTITLWDDSRTASRVVRIERVGTHPVLYVDGRQRPEFRT